MDWGWQRTGAWFGSLLIRPWPKSSIVGRGNYGGERPRADLCFLPQTVWEREKDVTKEVAKDRCKKGATSPPGTAEAGDGLTPPTPPQSWGEGTRWQHLTTRKRCERVVLPPGERCFGDTKGSPGVSHVAGATAQLYLLRAAEAPAGTEQPWLQLLPAGKPPARRRRRPVAGGLCLSPPLPAPRRAPPAQRCGEESGDPARLREK